jgi:LCP family protein required for cell wall assembly
VCGQEVSGPSRFDSSGERLRSLGRQVDGAQKHQTGSFQGLEALGKQIIDATNTGTRVRNNHSIRRNEKKSHRKGPRWSFTRKLITAAVALVLVLAGLAGATYIDVRRTFDAIPKAICRSCVHVASGKPYNVLVVGSDSREGDSGHETAAFGSASAVGGQRSDTIKIFHIDPSTGTARVLSIPRDTYVTTSGLSAATGLTGPEKINAAFNNGPEALIDTIQNTFGIPISHWIVIDFSAVIDSVKALGGIRLDFKYPVRDFNPDPDNPEGGVNESGLSITGTGCQVLDGNEVLALSRSRYYQYYGNGEWTKDNGYDLSRIDRQNTIIEAMVQEAESTYNPLKLQSLISSVKGDIAIDSTFSLGMLYDLAERYHAFSPSSLQTWLLPTVGQAGTPDGDVELVNIEAPSDYAETIAQFLGGAASAVTTPPLNQYGEPIAVRSTSTTMGAAPRTALPKKSTRQVKTSGAQAAVSASPPPFDPTLC